jgi:hypothetical protein
MTTTDRTTRDRHPAQYLALAVGVVYTLIAIAGFALTGFDNFADQEGALLLGFEVNPLHNLVHLVIGVAGLAMWNRLSGARAYGWLLVAVYTPTLIYGLAIDLQSDANILALNEADHWLHGISILAGLAIALWPARDRRDDGRTIDVTDGRTRATDSSSTSVRR